MDLARARQIMESNRHCVLATSSLDGRPWVSPLFFNCDASFRMVWESAADARHSQLIRENPRCAVVVADLDNPDEALYFDCQAHEVAPDGLKEALVIFQGGLHIKTDAALRNQSDYVGEKPLRLYEATPLEASTLFREQRADGYALDRRLRIELD